MNACSLKPLLNISSASSSTNIFMRFTCLTSNSAQWSVATKLDLSDFEMPLLDHAQDLHMQQLGDVFKITKAMPSHTSGSSRDHVNPWAEVTVLAMRKLAETVSLQLHVLASLLQASCQI